MEKMSFAFKSDLHYEEQRFNDSFRFVIFCEGKAQGATWYEDQAELICQAVNNHDRLAEENAKLKADNAELVEFIEKEVTDSVSLMFRPHISGVFAVIRHKLIQKYKGEINGN